MARAETEQLADLTEKIIGNHEITVIKKPGKTLAMVKMREPVRSSLFYLGEVLVCEAIVEIDGVKGLAVTLGDDYAKTMNMAIIDAACNKGIFTDEDQLIMLELAQQEIEQKENALHLQTMVSFQSMDQGGTTDAGCSFET